MITLDTTIRELIEQLNITEDVWYRFSGRFKKRPSVVMGGSYTILLDGLSVKGTAIAVRTSKKP